jgi:hypothetical protein
MASDVKLTKAQRVARPIINFLVERYFPNGLFFYGKGPLRTFDMVDREKKTVVGGMAALSLARHAHNSGATQLMVDAECITVNDEDIGDWRITVERIAGRSALENSQ